MKEIGSTKKTKIWTISGLAKRYGVSRKTMNQFAVQFGLDLKDINSLMDFAVWYVVNSKGVKLSDVRKQYPSVMLSKRKFKELRDKH